MEYEKSQQRVKELIFKKYLKSEENQDIETEITYLKNKSEDKEGQQRRLVNEYMGHLEHMLRNAEKRNIDLEIGTNKC